MSCPQEPTTEDLEFKCTAKGTGRNGRCIYYFWIPKDKALGNESVCETCQTINGVIHKLDTLLIREPWLETEGMAGAPVREAWEMEGLLEAIKEEEKDEGEEAFGDGMTTAERDEFRRTMGESFAATQGQGKKEEEVLSVASPSSSTEVGSGSEFAGNTPAMEAVEWCEKCV